MHKDFERHFKALFGAEYQDFLSSIAEKPKTSVRLNPRKPVDPGRFDIPYSSLPWNENAIILEDRPAFYRDPQHHAGAYYVQESSSMFFASKLQLPDRALVLDLCAAPGGKSTLLLDSISEDSFLISNELDFKRMRVLVENLNRWGRANVAVTNNKASDFKAFQNSFDLVVVDAPCSGEGMFRKDKNSLELWSPRFVQACASIQEDLLQEASKLVQPGGLLVYSTCTFEPNENEGQLKSFLENSPEWESVEIPIQDYWGIIQKDFNANGKQYASYYAYLWNVEGEGQFVSILRKKGSASAEYRSSKAGRKPQSLNVSEVFQPEGSFIHKVNDALHLFPAAWFGVVQTLIKDFNLWKLGTRLGDVGKKGLIPHQELAFTDIKTDYPDIDLSREEAMNYLRKEQLTLNGGKTGWIRLTNEMHGLGWIKHLGNRINNYLPKDLVIRKQ